MKHRNLGAAELMRLLDERSVELIDRNSIAARMASGRRIRVKLGIDPTAPHLHIGHMLPIRFLRAFQDAGHRAVLIIGDFTAQIGDPSGQGATRAQLFPGEVKRNERTYLRQVAGAQCRFAVPVEPGRDILTTLRLWRPADELQYVGRN